MDEALGAQRSAHQRNSHVTVAASGNGQGQRFASIGHLRPECRAEYLALHRDVPATVLECLRQHGISDYTIWERDSVLLGTYVYRGKDHAADLAAMIQSPVMRQWWAVCVPCFISADPSKPWSDLDCVFRMA